MENGYYTLNGRTVKIVVAAMGVSGFVVGAIFWAGAGYQRFKGIEEELIGIHSDIRELVTSEKEIEIIRNRQQMNEQRITRLEDSNTRLEQTVRQLK